MGEWNVLVAATLPEGDGTTNQPEVAQSSKQVLRELSGVLESAGARQGMSTSVTEGAVQATFGVQASDPAGAANEACRLWAIATKRLGLDYELDQIDVRSDAALDRDLARRRLPELMGLAEVAERLGVSKGRVGALRQENDAFPQPLAYIKAGPIWAAAGIDQFMSSWSRQPGRPATQAADPARVAQEEEVATTEESRRLLGPA